MDALDFRTRERIVLFAGATAVSVLALVLVAEIAGNYIGSAIEKLLAVLVVAYLVSRIAAHAKTLEEEGSNEQFARFAWLASPLIFLLLTAQILAPPSNEAFCGDLFGFGCPPQIQATAWTKLEWTADVGVFALFLVVCMAVWVRQSVGISTLLSRIGYTVVALLSGLLLIGIWASPRVFVDHVRLILSLFVLALAGTLLVAIVRRIERLDESEPPDAPQTPGAPTTPQSPAPPTIASMHPQP
jgi:hypothetical protein